MPRKAKELSDAALKAKAKKPGFHAVGGVAGLLLQVTPTGARSWVLRAMVNDRRRAIGLGSWEHVSLAEARKRAREARAEIDAGLDPIEERKRRRAENAATLPLLTFDQAAAELIAARLPEWKNAKHADQWRNTLTTYASPVIGRMDVAAVELQHIEAILRPIWATKTETASRVRMRIEAVLDWATVGGQRTGDNPARWKGVLSQRLAKPGKVKKKRNQPALPYTDMHRFMVTLRRRHGAARALEFAILTATRSNEVRGARWAEIDLQACTWTIPADRMKAGREHVIPLSARALEILQTQERMAGTDLVFPALRGRELSDATLAKVIKLMHAADVAGGGPGFMDAKQGKTVVPHGFRSTFKDWASEKTSVPNIVSEAALAHTIKDKSEAAYRRGDLLDKRRALMEAWADYVNREPTTGTVTQLRRKA